MKKIMLTGDRPTGRLHVGHYVGSLRRRVELQNTGDFDDIFISQVIGLQKPNKEMFDFVLQHINGHRNNTLMIGDSLSSDIQGGINAHLDTVWFNPHSLHNSTRLKPTFEIHHLTELKAIL